MKYWMNISKGSEDIVLSQLSESETYSLIKFLSDLSFGLSLSWGTYDEKGNMKLEEGC
ncbi:hypothetical protein [Enterobacter hormaechei]|uniref:hypothetical protein n=1 Tax=Enterobacter hormaechei TaxID=158836 RepID=UPI0014789889|nr:hypothetical protein [Enterobacter hormaechei]MBT2056212.1 hypothetical protein [Enterobacter hormaechei subsp. hoffmannii]MCW4742575.1 hypothetical protein [Enterobacter hormaechei subsp. hoffmannii]